MYPIDVKFFYLTNYDWNWILDMCVRLANIGRSLVRSMGRVSSQREDLAPTDAIMNAMSHHHDTLAV